MKFFLRTFALVIISCLLNTQLLSVGPLQRSHSAPSLLQLVNNTNDPTDTIIIEQDNQQAPLLQQPPTLDSLNNIINDLRTDNTHLREGILQSTAKNSAIDFVVISLSTFLFMLNVQQLVDGSCNNSFSNALTQINAVVTGGQAVTSVVNLGSNLWIHWYYTSHNKENSQSKNDV